MRSPGGQLTMLVPTTTQVNFDRLRCEEVGPGQHYVDTFSCFHCGKVIHVKPRVDPADMGGLCKQCFKLICPYCLDKGCLPLEAKLEKAEAAYHARRSYGL